jgi:hypothetical protein
VLAPQTKKLAKSSQKPPDVDAVPKTLKAIVIGWHPSRAGRCCRPSLHRRAAPPPPASPAAATPRSESSRRLQWRVIQASDQGQRQKHGLANADLLHHCGSKWSHQPIKDDVDRDGERNDAAAARSRTPRLNFPSPTTRRAARGREQAQATGPAPGAGARGWGARLRIAGRSARSAVRRCLRQRPDFWRAASRERAAAAAEALLAAQLD